MAISSKPTSEQKSEDSYQLFDVAVVLCCVWRVARLDLLHSMKGPFKFKLAEAGRENADLG